jgi:hypothetical protein
MMKGVKMWLSSHGKDLIQAYKNSFPDTSVSIPAVTAVKSSLSMYILFVYNIFFLIACFVNTSLEVTFRITLVHVEGKLCLCLINEASRHKDVWGSEGIAPPFLTSALDGGEWSYPCHLTPPKQPLVPITQEAGWTPELIWMLWRREIFYPCRL